MSIIVVHRNDPPQTEHLKFTSGTFKNKYGHFLNYQWKFNGKNASKRYSLAIKNGLFYYGIQQDSEGKNKFTGELDVESVPHLFEILKQLDAQIKNVATNHDYFQKESNKKKFKENFSSSYKIKESDDMKKEEPKIVVPIQFPTRETKDKEIGIPKTQRMFKDRPDENSLKGTPIESYFDYRGRFRANMVIELNNLFVKNKTQAARPTFTAVQCSAQFTKYVPGQDLPDVDAIEEMFGNRAFGKPDEVEPLELNAELFIN